MSYSGAIVRIISEDIVFFKSKSLGQCVKVCIALALIAKSPYVTHHSFYLTLWCVFIMASFTFHQASICS